MFDGGSGCGTVDVTSELIPETHGGNWTLEIIVFTRRWHDKKSHGKLKILCCC